MWYEFSEESQLIADGGEAMVLTLDDIFTAAASFTWVLWEKIKYEPQSLVGLVTDTIASLSSATPAGVFAYPIEAIVITTLDGVLCRKTIMRLRSKLYMSDTLDIRAVLGVSGINGTIMILFFWKSIWAAKLCSLIILGILACVVITIIVKLFDAITEFGVGKEIENNGLGSSVHAIALTIWVAESS